MWGYGDPKSGYTGSNVYGVNLSGNYSTTPGGPYYLTTAPIDCSNHVNVTLQFARWLNSDSSPHVIDTVDVSNDGVNWTNLYTNPTSSPVDSDQLNWTLFDYDICRRRQPAQRSHPLGLPGECRCQCLYRLEHRRREPLRRRRAAPPRPTALTPSTTLVTDNTVKTGTFSLAVVYNRAMDQSVQPSITFPTQDPGPTLSLNVAQSGWTGASTYVARYDVEDVNAKVLNIDVSVSVARDTAGITESPNNYLHVFSIDTLDPPPPALTLDLVSSAGPTMGTMIADLDQFALMPTGAMSPSPASPPIWSAATPTAGGTCL